MLPFSSLEVHGLIERILCFRHVTLRSGLRIFVLQGNQIVNTAISNREPQLTIWRDNIPAAVFMRTRRGGKMALVSSIALR